jgi:intracellular sulfur oxidation DsrE/DsrF family protein
MIEGYGTLRDIPNAGFQPRKDLEYKALFDCRELEEEGGLVAPGLDRLARFVNMLAGASVPSTQVKAAAVFHGPTTSLALRADAHAKHLNRENPNQELLQKLHEHGVELLVCGQSVLSHGFDLAEVDERIAIATSALLVLAVYQLDGYALLTY